MKVSPNIHTYGTTCMPHIPAHIMYTGRDERLCTIQAEHTGSG